MEDCNYKLRQFHRLFGDDVAGEFDDVCNVDTQASTFVSAFLARLKAAQRASDDTVDWHYPGLRPFADGTTHTKANSGLRWIRRFHE